MIKFLKLLSAILIAIGISSSALASDPNLLIGQLPNGLTYYIYRNSIPQGRADFFLSRSIGSIVEKDDERGLAHFLEHMAFNGSEHFPGNSMISWLESIGVKFGENLNAYTSIDETVYNISKVPIARQSVIDSCLLILRDWSCALSLLTEDIESERGVIKGEWRHRNNASNRLLQKAAPRIYGSSLYGHRLPMGLMSVIENFPPDLIRDFYRRNYTPDTEAIIVVGDINPKKIEKQIKKFFSKIRKTQSPISVNRTLNLNPELTAIAESDSEQAVEMIQLFFRYPQATDFNFKEKATHEAISSVLTTMLVDRFDAVELKSNSPVTNIGIGDTRFLLSDPIRALLIRGNVRPGKSTDAVHDLAYEIFRARKLGFSEKEFSNALRIYNSEIEAKLKNDSIRTNTQIARQISSSFLHSEPLLTPREIYETAKAAGESLTRDEVETYLKQLVDTTGKNVLILHYSKDSVLATPENESRLKQMFIEAAKQPAERFIWEESPMTLSIEEPIPGDIIHIDSNGPFASEIITLSNGLKVKLRHSTEKPGQIYLRGIGRGGLSQNYSEDKAYSLKLLNDVVSISGVGNLSNVDLRRFLKDKDLKVSAMISNTEETIEFASSPEMLENAFRLLRLKTTELNADSTAFQTLINGKINQAIGRLRNPIQSMGDTITMNVYSRHPLSVQPSVENLRGVDYETILATYRDRFSDFSDFDFYIVGDFDRATILEFLKRYIASLPTNGRYEKPRDIGYRFSPSKYIHFSRHMETPTAVVYQFRHTPIEYNLENIILASTIGQILKARLLTNLREEKGWTYSVTTHGSITAGINGDDLAEFMLPVYVKIDPHHQAEASSIIDATLQDMANNNISSKELDKIKEFMIKSVRDNRRDNAYWLLVLRQFDRTGLDLDTDYEAIVSALTPSKVSDFLQKVMETPSILRITMTPEL